MIILFTICAVVSLAVCGFSSERAFKTRPFTNCLPSNTYSAISLAGLVGCITFGVAAAVLAFMA